MSLQRKSRLLWTVVLLGVSVLLLLDISNSIAQKQERVVNPVLIDKETESAPTQNSVVGVCQSTDAGLSAPEPLDSTLSVAEVDAMTRLAVQRAGGLDAVIQPGDWVVIKVNILQVPGIQQEWGWNHIGTETDLRVVRSVIQQLIEQGRASRITVAEGKAWKKLGMPGTPSDQTYDGWTYHWADYGNLSYADMIAGFDAATPTIKVDYVDLDYPPYTANVPVPGGGISQAAYTIPDAILHCDKIIGIAPMKTHALTRVTLVNKLYVGISPASVYTGGGYWNHLGIPHYTAGGAPNAIERTISDLVSYHPADFGIVEGIWGTEGEGPQGGNAIKRNVILASTDPVAVDAASAYSMGFNPWDIDYLHYCHNKGFGINNLDYITVNGPTLDHIRYDFVKPARGPGFYQGRGNRTWLVNGPHSGNDIDTDYLGEAEADVSPVEGGMDGSYTWTKFSDVDDYMNLRAYYGGGPVNCATYAFTRIVAKDITTAELRFGADDGIKIWLNGAVVYENRNTGSWSLVQQKIPVSLQAGENRLLVKVTNTDGDYGFSMFVSEPDGDTPMGISYSTLAADAPEISLNSPGNNVTTKKEQITLSASVSAPGGGPLTVRFYGDAADASTLLEEKQNVPSGTTVSHTWSAHPLSVDANTIALWHFDEGTGNTVYDASPNHNNGTLNGATWTTGRFGPALHFNGQNQYVRVPDSQSLNPTSAITIELWTNREDNRSWSKMISKPYGLGEWPAPLYVTYGLAMQTRGSEVGTDIEFPISINGQPVGMAPDGNSYSTVPMSEWHYVAVTFDGQYHRIYIDGKLDREDNTPGTIDPGNTPRSDLFIGSPQPDVLSVGGYYLGSLDEVRISNRARTAQEIANAFNLAVGNRLTDGDYAWKVSASDGTNESVSETRHFTVDDPPLDTTPPEITLNHPADGYTTSNTSIELSATVNDPEKMTVWFYGGQSSDPSTLLYEATNVTGPSDVTYVWSTLPQELGVEVPGTAALWHFNEGSGTTTGDASANGNTGTISGATWTTGKFGSGLDFNGTDAYVQVPHSASLNMTGDLTLEAWIKPNGLTLNQTILTKRDGGGTCNYQMYVKDNTRGLSFYAGGSSEYHSTLVPVVGQWNYMAVVRSSGTLTFYLNGQTQQMAGPATLTANDQPVQIGSRSLGNDREAFNGTIDEVRITGRALTPEEIGADYSRDLAGGTYYWKVKASDGTNEAVSDTRHFEILGNMPPQITLNQPANGAPLPGTSAELSATVHDPEGSSMSVWFYGGQTPDPTTLLYQQTGVVDPSTLTYVWGHAPRQFTVDPLYTAGLWHFDENTGTGAADATANHNNGTIYGAAWTTGRFGYALRFDGVDDYVEMPDASSLDITGAVTIEAWMRFETIQSDWRVIVGKVNTTLNQSNYHLSKSADNKFNFGFNSTGDAGGWHGYSSNMTVSAEQWYYVAATYNDAANEVRIYINGAQDVLYPCEFSMITNDLPLRIGRNNNDGEALNATIDEVRITNRTLSPQEIAANYSSELSEGTYYWKVVASDEKNNTTTSAVWHFDMLGDVTPPEITLEHPVQGYVTTDKQVELAARVHDPDGSSMTVSFYGDQTQNPATLLYQVSNVSDPSDVTFVWQGSEQQELGVEVPATVALWHFNENAGMTTADATTNGNTGTISPTGVAWTTGKFGSALSFDGSNGYVEVPDKASLDVTGDLTLEAWIEPSPLAGYHVIVAKRNSTSICNYQMSISATGEVLAFYDGLTEYRSTLVPTVGQWNYVAVVHSAGTLTFYLNDQTQQMAGPASLTPNDWPVQIGSRSLWSDDRELFKGTIDEVRITSRALSSTEIAASQARSLAEGRYYWKVTASDGKHLTVSDVRYFNIAPGTPPAVPVLTAPLNQAVTNDNTPTFTWSATAGSGGTYTLEYALDAGFTTGLRTIPGIGAETYTVPDGDHLADNTYYWHVQAIDGVGRPSGYQTTPFSFTVNTQAPPPPSAFTVAPGNQKCHLSWTNPSATDFAGVMIRRNAWGDGAYPTYGGTPLGYPGSRTEGTLVYSGTAESFDDAGAPATMPRNIYYYTIFSFNAAGNYSAASPAVERRATNYWLGDIGANGSVDFDDDVVPFSTAYGSSTGGPGWNPFCDIGPSENGSRFGVPMPDGVIDFEDLMLLAMNYGSVSPVGLDLIAGKSGTTLEDLAHLVAFQIVPGAENSYSIVLKNQAATLKGIHLVVEVSGGELARVERGSRIAARSDVFFGVISKNEATDISVAALGVGTPFKDSGELARLRISKQGDDNTVVCIKLIDLRDVDNARCEITSAEEYDAPFAPKATALMQNFPNPFNPSTVLTFDLVSPAHVTIQIFDVSGRLRRTLVDERQDAGRHHVEWNGKDGNGSSVPSGIYFYRMQTQGYAATKKMILVR